MKTKFRISTAAILLLLSFSSRAQNQLHVQGKIHYGDTKSASILIVENKTDTTEFQIDKKKFKLPVLNSHSEYLIVFICGDKKKTFTIQPSEGTEPQAMSLDIDFDY